MVRLVPFYFQLMEDLRELLPEDFDPKEVLDLGAGNGNLTSRLIKWFPNAQYTIVDASEEMLTEAQQRFSLTIKTEKGMMQDINFPKQSIDLVASSFALHHLPDLEKRMMFEQMANWLRPGGYFIYSDLMIDRSSKNHEGLLDDWKSFVLQKGTIEDWKWLMDHYTQYDHPACERDQVKWLLDAGFHDVQTVRHDRYWVAMVARR